MWEIFDYNKAFGAIGEGNRVIRKKYSGGGR